MKLMSYAKIPRRSSLVLPQSLTKLYMSFELFRSCERLLTVEIQKPEFDSRQMYAYTSTMPPTIDRMETALYCHLYIFVESNMICLSPPIIIFAIRLTPKPSTTAPLTHSTTPHLCLITITTGRGPQSTTWFVNNHQIKQILLRNLIL